MIQRYLLNILIALDQMGNTLLGGDPDETISSRVGRRWPGSWVRRLIDTVFGPGHCRDNIEVIEIDTEVV